MSQLGMWSHRCPEEGCLMEVGAGEPCSWCGASEPAISYPAPAWNQHAPSVNLVDCDIVLQRSADLPTGTTRYSNDTGEWTRHP